MPNFCINFLNKAAKLLSISYDFAVAPSSDAWIKTVIHPISTMQWIVAPSSDAWIKTLLFTIACDVALVAPSSDAWIKTLKCLSRTASPLRRTLLGCVD